jgi:predicted esterase
MTDPGTSTDQLSPSPLSFPDLYIINPTSPHTHTAILLHGRGSNGPEFAEELIEDTKLPDDPTLPQIFPSWRFVFSSSRELWSTVFEEDIPAWFEAHSLTDITSRQELQEPGIREAVGYLDSVLDDEIERLGGDAQKVVLGGISQGAAVGMWTLLCGGERGKLGGFFGASTWLPCAGSIGEYVRGGDRESSSGRDFVQSKMSRLRHLVAQPRGVRGLLDTPVFLGHGVDDGTVDVELGRQARKVLEEIGMEVEWKE